MSHDVFRPRSEPALSIYEAFQAEAAKRSRRRPDSWLALESRAVWRAARDYADSQGWPTPLLADVAAAQRSAQGHVDYAAKWAHGLAHLMERQRKDRDS